MRFVCAGGNVAGTILEQRAAVLANTGINYSCPMGVDETYNGGANNDIEIGGWFRFSTHHASDQSCEKTDDFLVQDVLLTTLGECKHLPEEDLYVKVLCLEPGVYYC